MAKSTGRTPPELETPEVPPGARYIWNFYITMRNAATPERPIAISDISAYCSMTGVRLAPWELDWMLELDTLFMNSKPQQNEKSPL